MLKGIRIIELATYVAAPSAGGLLADWGADVIKVEPPEGCPMRYAVMAEKNAPIFDLDNRGKKAIALDMTKPESRTVLKRLLRDADVFLTNLREKSLQKMAIDYGSLKKEFPQLVYAGVSGYGTAGPDKDLPGFDVSAFFARSGMTFATTPKGSEPVLPRTAVGDHVTGIATAAAILTGIINRQKTGQGCFIDSTLLRAGIYALGSDLAIQLSYGRLGSTKQRHQVPNPLSNYFLTKDNHWLTLMPRPLDTNEWQKLCEITGADDLRDHPDYDTPKKRRAASQQIVDRLDACFAEKTLDEWAVLLDKAGFVWAPVLSPAQAVEDVQANAIGAFIDVPCADGSHMRAPAGPIRFIDAECPAPRAAPSIGQHRDEIMHDLGYNQSDIAQLKKEGVFGQE